MAALTVPLAAMLHAENRFPLLIYQQTVHISSHSHFRFADAKVDYLSEIYETMEIAAATKAATEHSAERSIQNVLWIRNWRTLDTYALVDSLCALTRWWHFSA